MGIDYTPISGFGIKVSENDLTEKFQLKSTNEDAEEIYVIEEFEQNEEFDAIAEVKEYGSSLSGDIDYVLLMKKPEKINPDEIAELLKKFRIFLDKYGFSEEIEFIEEIHQW